jgi:UPF0042 nucleotide-binding protein
MSNMNRLVVITGLAGSGKSLAGNCFEDLGYFCIDNLPVGLIQPFCDLIRRGGEVLSHAALVIDAREPAFPTKFPGILEDLRKTSIPVEVIFFESGEEILKRRFSESRRPHPLARGDWTLERALHEERSVMAAVRETCDRIIDTSRFSAHELRAYLKNAFGPKTGQDLPNVNIVSFGFKYGVPVQADLIFDVRFLSNPYFVEGLREQNGCDEEVQAFIDKQEHTLPFLRRIEELLDFLIPLYGAEGKSYLTIGLGCTGGKHRSVALSEKLQTFALSRNWVSTVSHRDLGKE